jgi:hypothetical protein
MSKHKSGDHGAESPSPPEIVCILVVDAIIDEFEVEICCLRVPVDRDHCFQRVVIIVSRAS